MFKKRFLCLNSPASIVRHIAVPAGFDATLPRCAMHIIFDAQVQQLQSVKGSSSYQPVTVWACGIPRAQGFIQISHECL